MLVVANFAADAMAVLCACACPLRSRYYVWSGGCSRAVRLSAQMTY